MKIYDIINLCETLSLRFVSYKKYTYQHVFNIMVADYEYQRFNQGISERNTR